MRPSGRSTALRHILFFPTLLLLAAAWLAAARQHPPEARAAPVFDPALVERGDRLREVEWLEQVSRGHFETRTLEMGLPRHATIDAADYDQDGDVDFAVGMFSFGYESTPSVEVWENLTIDKPRRAVAVTGPAQDRQR